MSAPNPALAPLVGSWRLLTATATFSDTGETVETFGPHPTGRVVLTPGGRITFLIARSNRQPPASDAERAAQAATAERAAALEPRSAVNVLSVAICHAKLGLLSDSRAKVESARLLRRFADEALALDPAYDYAHHVLGRWHREIAALGGVERSMGKARRVIDKRPKA